MEKKILYFTLFCLISLEVIAAGDECGGEREDDGNKSEALKYKIVAIASILVASGVGVSLPIMGKSVPALRPESNVFFVIKAFAAGVILSTGFVHVLPDAFESLSSPCLNENPWGRFPFAGFIAMASAIGTLMVDSFATSCYLRSNMRKFEAGGFGDEERADNQLHVHANAVYGHSHASSLISADSDSSLLLRHRVVSQVLELGIVVHSVIIGLSLGASESPKTIRPLIAALTFHQFFEGIGLGGCISQAKFKLATTMIMGLFFSLTTPIGIATGIGISNVYKDNSPTALIVEGTLNSASSGILIYMALVDLLAADFMNPNVQANARLLSVVNLSLLIGAACMSILAKWA